MLTYFYYLVFGEFLSLIIFLIFMARLRWNFLWWSLLHIVFSLITYQFTFQPYIIELFIIAWLVTSFFLFKSRFVNIQKRWLKILMVIIGLTHLAVWSDAWFARIIDSGHFYSLYIKNYKVNDDFSFRIRKPMRPYLFVDITNKTHPIFQQIYPTEGYHPYPSVSHVEWELTTNNILQIKIHFSKNSQRELNLEQPYYSYEFDLDEYPYTGDNRW